MINTKESGNKMAAAGCVPVKKKLFSTIKTAKFSIEKKKEFITWVLKYPI